MRPLGRTAAGVKGITLREGDIVVGLDVALAESEDEVLVVTENGYGKRTPVSEYRLSNRGGKGIKTATITERNGNIVCITTVTGEEDLMVVTNSGVIIRIDVHDISQNGRAAQGVRLMKLGDGQFVSTVAKVKEEELQDEDSDEQSSNEETTVDVETSDNDGHIDLRQDFMDRVNEDIESASDNENSDE